MRIINPPDANGYPRWVQLPQTKDYYTEIRDGDDSETQYWDDAHTAAMAAIEGWYPESTEYDLPDATADVATRRSHKVLYLHSGAEFSDDDTEDSMLHPRVDVRTTVTLPPNPQNRLQIGFRYVAAERRGARASEPDKDSWNRFTGIGIHVHEIGHLLGLEDAGTPSLNFEARTVTQPVAPAQAGPEGESGRNRSVERQTQTTAEGDSVQVETGEVEKEPVYLGHRIRGLGGSRHAAVRIPTKVVFGTLFCLSITAISANLYDTYIEGETEYRDDPWGGLDSVYYGLIAGSALGFPAGVTAIDPDDSLPWTLLAGVIPGAAGLYFLASESPAAGFLLAWVSPPVFSLATSELWRNPSQDHRSSFAVAPASMGGLSAVTTLPF